MSTVTMSKNAYTDTTKEVTYTISITNPDGNGFASNINVKDEINMPKIEAELLHMSRVKLNRYSSWTINAEKSKRSHHGVPPGESTLVTFRCTMI
ncbi:hypothetical protein O9992_16375 [Vibrio lentus]|nr:hypothetical protein [Vibrio lentus]